MPRDSENPRLVFTAKAWIRWQYLCHIGPTEVGCFALSSERDPLRVEDLLMVKQATSVVTVAFDDASVADLFDAMTDEGLPPNRYARIWLHTHPGSSASPSGIDEETFARVFGQCDWSVMAILSRTGRTYARLRVQAGVALAQEIPIAVDWSAWPDFALSYDLQLSVDQWQEEYDRLVEPVKLFPAAKADSSKSAAVGLDAWLAGDYDPFLTSSPHE